LALPKSGEIAFPNINAMPKGGTEIAMDSDRTRHLRPAEPEIPRERAFSIPVDVRTAHGSDGATVLDIRRGQMFRLNFVGSRILELLKQGLMEPEIADQLAIEFGIERTAAAADLHEFVQTLKKNHLLIADNEKPLP
jgi:Coenzyme PQQ synthesis protein D (PqqD)